MKTSNVKRDALIACLCVSGVLTSADVSGERKLPTEMSPAASTPSSASMTRDPRAGLPEAPIQQLPKMTGDVFSTPRKTTTMNPFATPHFERAGTPVNTTTENVEESKTPIRHFTGSNVPPTPVANRHVQLRHVPKVIENVFEEETKQNSAAKKTTSYLSPSRDFAAYDLNKKLKACAEKEKSEKDDNFRSNIHAANQSTKTRSTRKEDAPCRIEQDDDTDPLDENDEFLSGHGRRKDIRFSTQPFGTPPKPKAKPSDSAPSHTEHPEMPDELLCCFGPSPFELLCDNGARRRGGQEILRENFDARIDTLIKLKEYAWKLIESNFETDLVSWRIEPEILTTFKGVVTWAACEDKAISCAPLSKRMCDSGKVKSILRCIPLLKFLSRRIALSELLQAYKQEQNDKEEDEKRHAAAAAKIKKEREDGLRAVEEKRVTPTLRIENPEAIRMDFHTRIDTLIRIKEYAWKLIERNLATELESWQIEPEFLITFEGIVTWAEYENTAMSCAPLSKRMCNSETVQSIRHCKPLLMFLRRQIVLGELLKAPEQEQHDKESERKKLLENEKRCAAIAAMVKKAQEDRLRAQAAEQARLAASGKKFRRLIEQELQRRQAAQTKRPIIPASYRTLQDESKYKNVHSGIVKEKAKSGATDQFSSRKASALKDYGKKDCGKSDTSARPQSHQEKREASRSKQTMPPETEGGRKVKRERQNLAS